MAVINKNIKKEKVNLKVLWKVKTDNIQYDNDQI